MGTRSMLSAEEGPDRRRRRTIAPRRLPRIQRSTHGDLVLYDHLDAVVEMVVGDEVAAGSVGEAFKRISNLISPEDFLASEMEQGEGATRCGRARVPDCGRREYVGAPGGGRRQSSRSPREQRAGRFDLRAICRGRTDR